MTTPHIRIHAIQTQLGQSSYISRRFYKYDRPILLPLPVFASMPYKRNIDPLVSNVHCEKSDIFIDVLSTFTIHHAHEMYHHHRNSCQNYRYQHQHRTIWK